MKRKSILKSILLCMLVLLILTGRNNIIITMADEIQTVGTYSNVKIKATVPDEFNKDIAFVLVQTSTDFRYQVVLTKNKGYEATLTVLNNMEYTVNVKIDEAKYKISGIQDKYVIDKSMVNINFAVKDGLTQIESGYTNEGDDQNANEKNEAGIKDVYETYINSVSFIKDDTKYKPFLDIYSYSIMKGYFLEAESTNTEEQWNEMTEYERFNYYILYVRPKILMTGINAVKSVSELKDGLTSEKQLLKNIDRGNEVVKAIETVWEWEWNKYLETGEFPNLYNIFEKDSILKHVESNESTVNINQQNEENRKSNDNTIVKRLFKGIKNNIFSITLLIVVGIGVIIVIYKDKKRMD